MMHANAMAIHGFALKQPALSTEMYVNTQADTENVVRAVLGDVQTVTAAVLEIVPTSSHIVVSGLYIDVFVGVRDKTYPTKFKILLLGLPATDQPADFNQQCDLLHDLIRRAIFCPASTRLFVDADILAEYPDNVLLAAEAFGNDVSFVTIDIHQHNLVGAGRTVNSRNYREMDKYQLAIPQNVTDYFNTEAIRDRKNKILEWAANAEAQFMQTQE